MAEGNSFWGTYGHLLQVVFFAVAALFLYELLSENVSMLSGYDYGPDPGLLVLACMLYVLHLTYQAFIWHLIVSRFSVSLGTASDVRYWLYSQLGKYVPGKALLLASRAYFYKRGGVPVNRFMYCFVFEVSCAVLAALVVCGISFSLSPLSGSAKSLALLSVSLLAVVFVHPKIFSQIISLAGRITGRRVSRDSPACHILGFVCLYAVDWFIVGLSFYFLVYSVFGQAQLSIAGAVFVFMVSFLSGYFFIFAPSGIGVREGVMVLILSNMVPLPLALAASVYSRLYFTLSEAALILFSIASGGGVPSKAFRDGKLL